MDTYLLLRCPEGFLSAGVNNVIAEVVGAFGRNNVSRAVATLWNAYWDVIDGPNPFEDMDLHTDIRLVVGIIPGPDGKETEAILVPSGESFTLEDFATNLEDVISLEIRCANGSPNVVREG
jgi:hypothetical protein